MTLGHLYLLFEGHDHFDIIDVNRSCQNYILIKATNELFEY